MFSAPVVVPIATIGAGKSWDRQFRTKNIWTHYLTARVHGTTIFRSVKIKKTKLRTCISMYFYSAGYSMAQRLYNFYVTPSNIRFQESRYAFKSFSRNRLSSAELKVQSTRDVYDCSFRLSTRSRTSPWASITSTFAQGIISWRHLWRQEIEPRLDII